NAKNVEAGEALLAFGPLVASADRAALVLNLSARGDLIEAAANLFSHLRAVDAAGTAAIAVMPVPSAGLGEAINDRLVRAAAPRRLRSETIVRRAIVSASIERAGVMNIVQAPAKFLS